jgi:hypothetical protein
VFCPLILINPLIAIRFPLLVSETVKLFYGDKCGVSLIEYSVHLPISCALHKQLEYNKYVSVSYRISNYSERVLAMLHSRANTLRY